MTAAARIHAVPAPRPGELILEGELFAGRVLLDERSAVLASRIGPAFLAEAGWDPGSDVASGAPAARPDVLPRPRLPDHLRRSDLLEKIHAAQAAPPAAGGIAGPAVSRASLQADLLATHERAIRLAARIRQLEQRLSDELGQQTWRESGLGAPADIDVLNQKITHHEQQAAGLRLQLEDRDGELAAARAANRELMTRLNQAAGRTIHGPPLHHPRAHIMILERPWGFR